MAQKRISRQQQFARMEENSCRHALIYPGEENGKSSAGSNTLAPPDRYGHHIAKKERTRETKQEFPSISANLIIENIVLLALLVGITYAIYRATIYLLNQA